MHTSVCWLTVLLEDVSFTAMAHVDEAFLAPAFSTTSWQYGKVKIFHWSDFIVAFRSHLNSFADGTRGTHIVQNLGRTAWINSVNWRPWMEQISQNGPKTKN